MVKLKQFKDVPNGMKYRFLNSLMEPIGDTYAKGTMSHEATTSPDAMVAVEEPLKRKSPPKKPPAKKAAEPVEERPSDLVKITRSFQFKKNLGSYESCDFFCSQTVECKAEDAEAKSLQVIDFCKAQVKRDLTAFMEGGDGVARPRRRLLVVPWHPPRSTNEVAPDET